jgi:hypothetical protein
LNRTRITAFFCCVVSKIDLSKFDVLHCGIKRLKLRSKVQEYMSIILKDPLGSAVSHEMQKRLSGFSSNLHSLLSHKSCWRWGGGECIIDGHYPLCCMLKATVFKYYAALMIQLPGARQTLTAM